MRLTEGTTLAHRFRLGPRLGQGGAASAYRARDLVRDEDVALKLLDAELPPALLIAEFERLRELAHPHLARVRELHVVSIAGKPRALYTADLVSGGDLRAWSAREGSTRVPLCDVLDALHTLHAVGLRHGDVKPENVLIDAQGRAVLIDLGCAAPLGHASHALSGTPGYMAPELREGDAADERADLFAFGVMMRELGATDEALIARLTGPKEARPASAREVLAELGDTRDVESVRGRAPRFLGREGALGEASSLLRDCARGREGPRVLWIEGAAGSGRSRFLRELGYALLDTPIDWLEARTTLRDAMARKLGEAPPGDEPLLDQVDELAEADRATVLVLDDAREGMDELLRVLRALPPAGRLAAVITSTQPAPIAAHVLRLTALGRAEVDEWAGANKFIS